ncbi:hypothetical protein LX69_01700 [Breznakibacter xylanolyticus]|uniref:Uncharacterized protein n=1 Tax=Breznakibacter xylanolyticus TaxID=990 RepID=A0A2W7NU78_9BACT|nr:hypothetical protein LX69_01700 [Breznakibacter xylanolyticus]
MTNALKTIKTLNNSTTTSNIHVITINQQSHVAHQSDIADNITQLHNQQF